MPVRPLSADTVREALVPCLRKAISRLPPSVAELVWLHFQSTGQPNAPLHAGKLYRAALTLAWDRALGGDGTNALHAAVAVELVHNASLVHDDLIDQDRVRRGRETVWAQRGPAAGLLAGDALFFLAVQELNGAGHPLDTRGVAELTAAVQQMIGGEWADTQVPRDVVGYMAACEGKTGSLTGAACALGGLTAAGTSQLAAADGCIDRIRAFGLHLGAAFQITDDLLNLWGDPRETGKPHRGDLVRGRNSYPILAALAGDSAASAALRSMLAPGAASRAGATERCAELIEEAGGRVRAEAEADRHLQQALSILDEVCPDGPGKEALAVTAYHAVHRHA